MKNTDFTSSRSSQTASKLRIPKNNLWVFGYGSLMWDPGFPHVESQSARMYGFHRRLCLWSTRYRGTEKNPGLVAGLDQGGSCTGMAFRVSDADVDATLDYLFERELATNSYKPTMTPIHLQSGDIAQALTFVSIVTHPQYAPKMDAHSAMEFIRKAQGPRGTNTEYLLNTVQYLDALGIQNTEIHKIAAAL